MDLLVVSVAGFTVGSPDGFGVVGAGGGGSGSGGLTGGTSKQNLLNRSALEPKAIMWLLKWTYISSWLFLAPFLGY